MFVFQIILASELTEENAQNQKKSKRYVENILFNDEKLA